MVMYLCLLVVLPPRPSKEGAMAVFHQRANQVMADRLLYLFSSVSSPKFTVDDDEPFEINGVVNDDKLFKLLRLVAKGLKND